jgi:tetratricopeptide (TPR) repeat protein
MVSAQFFAIIERAALLPLSNKDRFAQGRVSMIKNRLFILLFPIAFLANLGVGQVTPTPQTPKLSEILAKRLASLDPNAEIPRENRQKAYSNLMEAQRFFWQASRTRNSADIVANVKSARTDLQTAVELDPSLSEAYTLLAESFVNPMVPPSDVEEAIALAAIAVKLNKNNYGGHRLLARLYTFRSNLNNANINEAYSAKAITEWNEIARLDPRNAEAWAFLSEFYGKSGKTNEQIRALQRWQASTIPIDRYFYQNTMRGGDDLSPENASKKLGPALLKAGRAREAVEVLSQVIADDPSDNEAVELLREALETSDAKTAASTVDALRQAVYANPGNLSLLDLLAEVQAKSGNVDDAVKTLESAYEKLMPNNRDRASAVEASIGDIYAGAGRPNDAVAAYEKALVARGLDNAQTVDADEREFAMGVFDRLITVYKRQNRVEDAKAVIERARKLFGREDIYADRQLISLYQETGDRQGALATVHGLRAQNPDDIALLRLEATLLGETGQVDKGVEIIKKRIADGASGNTNGAPRVDDDFSNYLFIAQLYDEAGRGNDAVAAAQKAISLASGSEQHQIGEVMLASAQQSAGKFADAEATLRGILKESPDNPIALNNLGYFLLERGERYNEALDMIQKAVKVYPTNPSFLDSLGFAYFKLDKLDEAEKSLSAAADIDPSSGTIQEHLGDVLQKKGKIEDARAAWKRAAQLASKKDDVARINEKLAKLK